MADQFSTPVILIIFNRPQVTVQVLDVLRKLKPLELYVVADGPRSSVESDVQSCKDVRALIDTVDWECQIYTDYSDVNLGCASRVSSGITNAFKIFDRAVILEDDTVPDLTFFRFCEEMLIRYESDERVMHISGTNIIGPKLKKIVPEDYYFSKNSGVWGWATWKRAWEKYDHSMSAWTGSVEDILAEHTIRYLPEELKHYNSSYAKAASGELDSWGFRWHFAVVCNKGYAITPTTNLVKNIGFSKDATHTTDIASPLSFLKAQRMTFPLVHPETVKAHNSIEHMIAQINFGLKKQTVFGKWKRSLIKRYKRLIKND